jgi:thioredoxin 1
MAVELTESNFEELVLKSDKPVMVDLWAEWCGPCRILGPIVDEIYNEYENKAVIGKLNVDQHPNLSSQLGVRNIPTVLFFKDGQVVDKHIGVAPKVVLTSKLDEQLN